MQPRLVSRSVVLGSARPVLVVWWRAAERVMGWQEGVELEEV